MKSPRRGVASPERFRREYEESLAAGRLCFWLARGDLEKVVDAISAPGADLSLCTRWTVWYREESVEGSEPTCDFALSLAAERRPDFAHEMLDRGADPKPGGGSLLWAAAYGAINRPGESSLFGRLLESGVDPQSEILWWHEEPYFTSVAARLLQNGAKKEFAQLARSPAFDGIVHPAANSGLPQLSCAEYVEVHGLGWARKWVAPWGRWLGLRAAWASAVHRARPRTNSWYLGAEMAAGP